MGEVIRKNAAVGDIFADVRSTLINAAAKGGEWKDLADAQLGSLLAQAVEAQQAPESRVHQLEQVRKALARTAQTALQGLKRRYKAASLSEADIHTVIPDRPRPAASAKAVPGPAPTATNSGG